MPPRLKVAFFLKAAFFPGIAACVAGLSGQVSPSTGAWSAAFGVRDL